MRPPSEQFRREPAVFLHRELAETVQAVATLDRHQIELCSIVTSLNDKASEARVRLNVADNHPRVAKCPVDGRYEPIDGSCCQAEEVEIARLSPNVTTGDQRAAAGEGKVFRFFQTGDDRSDLLLKRTQHLLVVAVTSEPISPLLSNRGRQHELVPELEELVGVDVQPHVVFGAFPQNLS